MENIKKSIILLFIILFIVISEAIAQYCVRRCKDEQKWHFFILAVFMYSLVCMGLYIVYGFKTMGIVNLLWSCLSIVSILTIGTVYFHDEINIYDIVGIFIIFIGFGLVFVKGH